MYKNILLPTDGLGKCQYGTCHGVLLAKGLHAKVTAVCITGKLSPQDILKLYDANMLVGALDAKRAKEAMENVEAGHKDEASRALAVAKKMCDDAGVPCELSHLPGAASADGILKVAAEKSCDLIFLSTHGNPGMLGSLFGTVATKVLSHSKIPVLVHHCGGPG
jgi:nucleotide-binding universal stress UspA family protein